MSDCRFINILTRALQIFCSLCMMFLTVLVFINVVLRYVAHTSIIETEELSLYVLIWMVYMGSILMFAENGHINVNFLERSLSRSKARMLRIVCDILMLATFFAFMVGCYIQGSLDMSNTEIITGIPRGLKFASGFVFSIAAMALLLARLYRSMTTKLTGGAAA